LHFFRRNANPPLRKNENKKKIHRKRGGGFNFNNVPSIIKEKYLILFSLLQKKRNHLKETKKTRKEVHRRVFLGEDLISTTSLPFLPSPTSSKKKTEKRGE
jgi:hypothetical protein